MLDGGRDDRREFSMEVGRDRREFSMEVEMAHGNLDLHRLLCRSASRPPSRMSNHSRWRSRWHLEASRRRSEGHLDGGRGPSRGISMEVEGHLDLRRRPRRDSCSGLLFYLVGTCYGSCPTPTPPDERSGGQPTSVPTPPSRHIAGPAAEAAYKRPKHTFCSG